MVLELISAFDLDDREADSTGAEGGSGGGATTATSVASASEAGQRQSNSSGQIVMARKASIIDFNPPMGLRVGADEASGDHLSSFATQLRRAAAEKDGMSFDAFKELAGDVFQRRGQGQPLLEGIFRALDADGSGSVDPKELAATLTIFHNGSMPEKLRFMFETFGRFTCTGS